MKNFIAVIDEEAKSRGITSKEMASILCTSDATLSRLRHGVIKDLAPETLIKIQIACEDDPDFQTRLLIAYLKDKAVGPAGPWIVNLLDSFKSTKKMQTPMLRESPPPCNEAPPDAYSCLAEAARKIEMPNAMVRILQKLIFTLPKNPHLRLVLKGLSQGK